MIASHLHATLILRGCHDETIHFKGRTLCARFRSEQHVFAQEKLTNKTMTEMSTPPSMGAIVELVKDVQSIAIAFVLQVM